MSGFADDDFSMGIKDVEDVSLLLYTQSSYWHKKQIWVYFISGMYFVPHFGHAKVCLDTLFPNIGWDYVLTHSCLKVPL